jgi:hypothetical protein
MTEKRPLVLKNIVNHLVRRIDTVSFNDGGKKSHENSRALALSKKFGEPLANQ